LQLPWYSRTETFVNTARKANRQDGGDRPRMSAVALPNLAGGGDALAGGSGRGLPPGWVAGQGLAAPAAAGGRRGTGTALLQGIHALFIRVLQPCQALSSAFREYHLSIQHTRLKSECLGFQFHALLTAIRRLNGTICMGNTSCIADFALCLKGDSPRNGAPLKGVYTVLCRCAMKSTWQECGEVSNVPRLV